METKFGNDESPPRKNSFFKNVRTYFREYCNCTSIHGFQYFGEKRTIFERIWWIIIFLICLIACISAIYGVYRKWEGSPVIVNFANQGTPIYQIPFPAITICPESKSFQPVFSYTRTMQKMLSNASVTPAEHTTFEYMSLICKYQDKLNSSYSKPDIFPDDFFETVHKIKPQLLLYNCMYLGNTDTCSRFFIPIMTDEGVCYTFNMLDRGEIYNDNVVQFRNYQRAPRNMSNWSVEQGYAADAGLFPYPARALFAGAVNGLSFNIITPKTYLDFACRKSSLQGYKVILHSPMRIPRPSQQYFRVPLDQSVVGAVQPVMISTSDKVQMYNPKRRGCYFPSERRLKLFKIYTSLNCKLECLTNFTLRTCGCVNFFMPRDNETRICGTGKITCMRNAENFMQIKDLHRKLSKKDFKRADDCDCLPICTDVTYDVETSQTDWDWKKSYSAHLLKPTNDSHLSSLTIFFKSDNFVTSERNELYGPIDFLANFGGLLGLFTGFSVLSLMEILYFLSIRMICNNRLYGYWAGPEM
ncbi:hypothetical protein Zmor_024794 [Zophobas morio]|uniref:Uncharacterized protein n=1 Tax=Zophobas morio TaxID=2755281 RepID=A0AA38I156_9CUCU|nr:hypothetical protein Zmor_024794 [Zophobas morio]